MTACAESRICRNRSTKLWERWMILKDADVIDHSLSDPTKDVKDHEKARYAKLCEELGLK